MVFNGVMYIYVQANASGEQHLKVDRCKSGAAADSEADAIGEKQLCTQSCPAPDYSRRRTRGK